MGERQISEDGQAAYARHLRKVSADVERQVQKLRLAATRSGARAAARLLCRRRLRLLRRVEEEEKQ
jgi:hypothetical protein